MKAVTYHGRRDVRVDDEPDPKIDQILPLLADGDPLAVDDLASHRLPLEQAPHA